MRRFLLWRRHDASGVSGTGVVAEGVQFGDGTCALRWRTENRSTALYESLDVLEKIHGHGGASRLVWVDDREHGPTPCTLVDGEKRTPSVSYPTSWLIKGDRWGSPSGAVDPDGRPIFVGAKVRLRTRHGELSNEGEVIDVSDWFRTDLCVGVYGTDCGPTAYPISEIEVLETLEEYHARRRAHQAQAGASA